MLNYNNTSITLNQIKVVIKANIILTPIIKLASFGFTPYVSANTPTDSSTGIAASKTAICGIMPFRPKSNTILNISKGAINSL